MKVKCRGKIFDVYTLNEALKLNIVPIDDWRKAKKDDWIFTRDEKVIKCLGRRLKYIRQRCKTYCKTKSICR